MPNVTISVGGRAFDVACQPGEEAFLQSAAGVLDAEAQVFAGQGGLTESRLLLMAGLMLADRTAGLQEELNEVRAQLNEARAQADAVSQAAPKTIEVPVIPQAAASTLANLTAEAEALAEQIEEKRAAASERA